MTDAMRLCGASAALAAVLGVTPALAQDFSITNTVAPADAGRRDLMRQLQAWWDVHAAYPPDAAASDQDGAVKLHLVIQPDGNIAPVDVVQSSGSCALDTAGAATFRGAFVRPAGPGAQPIELELSLRYVLTHRHDQAVTAGATPGPTRRDFTITNDPVRPTVIDPILQRSCTGTVVEHGLRNHPDYGSRNAATAIFFRRPDGSPWVKFSEGGFSATSPVTELGKVAQWMGPPKYYNSKDGQMVIYTRYTVWPDGENHLIGDIALPPGTVDLTCVAVAGPPVTSTSAAWAESPQFQSGVAVPPTGACRR